ncbi:hypothetical protein M3Y98_01163800 [Aphelenchoides besseyi]|nr:hypothetical protein M3Y98_01160400 [Aphelenchoides besseyi]KAI6174196.1 hypothetical protein M3Y98_01163800 [Aphelenchoides besseyi]KAI6210872.1 hypothetical protein M3Y96_00373900 [Aphelenchoides besseyi]
MFESVVAMSALQLINFVVPLIVLAIFGCAKKKTAAPVVAQNSTAFPPASGQKVVSKVAEVQVVKKTADQPSKSTEPPKPALAAPVKNEKKTERPKSTKEKSQKQVKSSKKAAGGGEEEEGDGYEACPEMTPEQLEKIAQETPGK